MFPIKYRSLLMVYYRKSYLFLSIFSLVLRSLKQCQKQGNLTIIQASKALSLWLGILPKNGIKRQMPQWLG
jgi:hypothetical protein